MTNPSGAQDFTIARIRALPSDLEPLVQAALAEGFPFMHRLSDEWRSGENRFELPGEAFFEAREAGSLAGVCGLNRDPFTEADGIGRVRHLYVRRESRRRSIGRRLVLAVLAEARATFRIVRLRTPTDAGDRFYRALGFTRATGLDSTETHLMALGESR